MNKPEDILDLHQRELAKFDGMSSREIFSDIYEKAMWGTSADPTCRYFSGSGSHDRLIVEGYAGAVGRFLEGLGEKPAVVDLGCGDFHVGARIVPFCRGYLGCDIVEGLVAHNVAHHAEQHVAFQAIDIVDDSLPPGDVVLLRQVLQHLSNAQITKVLLKVRATYRYLVLTEHVPAADRFVANLDKPTGCDIRLSIGSGIVITEHPFAVKPIAEQVLCEFPEAGGEPMAPGLIRTIAYRFR